jgi:hypothetical protein
MCSHKRLSLSAVFSLFFVLVCSSVLPAQTALTTLQGTQGGMIVYGLVDGATTPAMAMARILHNVQNGCGEKPQVGKVFRVRGSNSDAVFFTVTKHAGGNVPVAGMLIASQTGGGSGPGERCGGAFWLEHESPADPVVRRMASGRGGGQPQRLDGQKFGLAFRSWRGRRSSDSSHAPGYPA